jgi:hypothetical protein
MPRDNSQRGESRNSEILERSAVRPSPVMERRVRISAALVFLGLIVELTGLRLTHPTAFLVFALVGIPLVGAGIIAFQYSLASAAEFGATQSVERINEGGGKA